MTDAQLHTYAAMAHRGRMAGKTFEVKAPSLWGAKIAAAETAGTKTEHVSVQLQAKADGTEVVGAVM